MKKCRMGLVIILAALLAIPMNVGATTTSTASGSSMTITVGTTNNTSAGDTVTVRLVGSNNPGISTLGLQLGYNDEYLNYTGTATWSDTIMDNGIQMVTAATVDGSPVVNISAVFENAYTSNENMVTLSFTVKRAFDDMSTLLTPTVREVTDSNLSDVKVNWVYDQNAGLTTDDGQNLVPDDDGDNNTGTGSGTTGGDTTGGDTTGGDTTDNSTNGTNNGTTNNGNDANSSDKTSTSGNGTTASSGTGGSGLTTTTTPSGTVKKDVNSGSNVDNTPTTGTVDLTLVLGIVITLFVGISGVCLFVLKKKNAA